ncbi:hypothetical protein JR316_0006332 [Psilocybe cubensis]|uniref:Uncharacterized protein n=2 Tax=Psilocybe cubensis TaxID=181762 RepID=A0ACB8H3N3_PSICU|nr:hypothetical protein JR316_0006332 [Psilocybe cubensis]KAH9481805.1 hypothetical protein JR316_0006332 [Psilocybe cubensis]
MQQQQPLQAYNDVGMYDSQGRPQSRVQRKPPPVFLASPNGTPLGTATSGNFPVPTHPSSTNGAGGGAYPHMRTGNPSLQKYNPEPFVYTPRTVDQHTENVYRPPGRWAQRDRPLSIPSTAGISSITHLGSGGSDYHRQQLQYQQGQEPSANPSQSPLLPPPQQQHQSQKQPSQHQHQQSTSSSRDVHTHPADLTGESEYTNAYGGIEDDQNVTSNRDQRLHQPLPPPPPEHTDSSGALSYLTTPALSAHKVPPTQ